MKKIFFFLFIVFIAFSFQAFSQTDIHKNNISIGGGSEDYVGDLGSVWLKFDEEWYGFGSLRYNRYLNKSVDLGSMLTWGDYGHCIDEGDDLYWSDGTSVLNMLTRLTCLTIQAKYKLNNDLILKTTSKISPFVSVGLGLVNSSEHWWQNKTRANIGTWVVYNAQIGLNYNFYKNFVLSYSFGFNYLSTDGIDKHVDGSNDLLMQNNFMLGYNF